MFVCSSARPQPCCMHRRQGQHKIYAFWQLDYFILKDYDPYFIRDLCPSHYTASTTFNHHSTRTMNAKLLFDRFLPRDVMRKRGLCCRDCVRPFARLSVALVHCIHTAEDIVNLLSRPGSAIILVFFCVSSDGTQFQGRPLQRGIKCTGWNNCDFRLKLLFISETVRDRPIIAIKR